MTQSSFKSAFFGTPSGPSKSDNLRSRETFFSKRLRPRRRWRVVRKEHFFGSFLENIHEFRRCGNSEADTCGDCMTSYSGMYLQSPGESRQVPARITGPVRRSLVHQNRRNQDQGPAQIPAAPRADPRRSEKKKVSMHNPRNRFFPFHKMIKNLEPLNSKNGKKRKKKDAGDGWNFITGG